MEMIARDRPMRCAAPAITDVGSAWFAMFMAANDRPHMRRAISNGQRPDATAYM